MRKYIFLVTGMLMALSVVYSQRVVLTENFDGGSVSFSSTPANGWSRDSSYYVNAPYSYRGKVPNAVGDSVVLTSQTYDFSTYSHVMLRFKHICKISPQDKVSIEYRISGQIWQPLPVSAYMGQARYQSTGFNASSYPEWIENDSTIMPGQSWWKEETFNVGPETGGDYAVQFRFIIKHVSIQGTQLSYGWLLDDFEITADINEIHFPVVEFISPFVQGAVSATGPYEINALVKTTSSAPVKTPLLKYTAIQNGHIVAEDSVLMDSMQGDSQWKCSIPQFVAGTEILYSITGQDTTGNYATAISGYIIRIIDNYYIIAGTGAQRNYFLPISMYAEDSWSRQLYLASELQQGIVGGFITKLAWEHASPDSWFLNNQSCYFRAVDDESVTSTNYEDPIAAGGELVWSGIIGATGPGWVEIVLDNLFFLPANKNLLVYWNHAHGASVGGLWNCTATAPQYMAVFVPCNCGGSGTTSMAVGLTDLRPNARFYINRNNLDNSASIYSIDIDDTLVVSSSSSIPVVATIKNKGIANLTSATVYYSVNGTTPQQYNWNGDLSWDMDIQLTIGNYMPKVSGNDTVAVWVKMPNGKIDSAIHDDTLIKVIYGSGDITMYFVDPPADTVTNTGPFEITAEIFSYSGAAVGQPFLFVESTFEGITKYDTLTMLNTSGNLWKTNIPHKVFGSQVRYAVKLTDIFGSHIEIEGSYTIKRPFGFIGEIIIGTDASMVYSTPINLYYEYGFSRQLYLGTEFFSDPIGGVITKLAWDYASTTSWTVPNQTCYFQAVDDAAITDAAYINPVADGAELVWQGTLSASGAGWIEIILDNPFYLPPGKNLLIYWEQKSGGPFINPPPQWRHTVTSFYSTVRGSAISSFLQATISTVSDIVRPNARFYIIGREPESNSVALVAINSPENAKGLVANGTPVPVQISIQNKGLRNLDSCVIKWSLNGQIQTDAIVYHGTLPDGFTDTITIGSYIPEGGKWDTIVAWVSMPNGVVDSINYDDTLMITSWGCTSILSGTVTIGNGGTIASIDDALQTIRRCGISGGDITLALKGTFHENIDLTGLSDYMGGYTLTITSVDNHPDSAIIRPPSGVGITLNNNRNLIIKNITVDAATSGTVAVEFTGACTNIVIRDCKLLADTTTTNVEFYPIYKGVATGSVDSIFFINNLLDGGYNGFNFIGGVNDRIPGTNVIFDSNTVTNSYFQAIYPINTTLTSCSYNTVLSRTVNAFGNWYGIHMYYSDGPVIGNRIIQRSTEIGWCIGIYSTYHNYHYISTAAVGKALIANNEIILNTITISFGIYVEGLKSEILHNSIYISGTGQGRGIYIDNSFANDLVIKNNNIVLTSSTAYVIYFEESISLNMYDIDYNNLYTTASIGYYRGETLTTMPDWNNATGQKDLHSISILPNFIDPSKNLKFTENTLFCNKISPIDNDIENTSRSTTTTMGCYEIAPRNVNVALGEIKGLREGDILSQTDNIKIAIQNTGSTALTSVNLEWSINGVSQNIGGSNYPVLLDMGESDSVTLGQITYSSGGKMNIKVWLNSVNGGVTDEYRNDDTSNISILVCNGGYSGLLTVGLNASNDFQTIEEANNALNLCGLSGNTTLAFEPGIYNGSLDFSNTATLLSGHTLTITSTTDNADDVVFRTFNKSGIRLSNAHNLVIKAITIDASAMTVNGIAIEFTESCTNIVVRDCKLLGNTTSTNSSNNLVYKRDGTGFVDSIFFINNILDGGYYGFSFDGGIRILGPNYNLINLSGTNVIFDSNTVTNNYFGGIYSSRTIVTSCSYNTVLSKTTNTSQWNGININAESVIGNRIIQRNAAVGITTGLSVGSGAFIANNEIILDGTSNFYCYGINTSAGDSKLEILHNSIYISGYISGTREVVYGIYVYNDTYNPIANEIVIKNNNIVLTSPPAYPVYFNMTGYSYLYDMDYNNFYAPNYTGYYGGNITTMADWQQTTGKDLHSVSIFPDFIDPSLSLELATHNDTLSCPKAGVLTDIKGVGRASITTIGAYQSFVRQDFAILQISPWNTEVINNQIVQVNVDLLNAGVAQIDSITFGWSLNGNLQPIVSWTPTTPLSSLKEQNVSIGTFQVNSIDTFNIVVWIKTINGKQDTVNWDTVRAITVLSPLAEFMAPVEDTIYYLDLEVNAKIRTVTGAPVTPPVLYVETVVNGVYFFDSVSMIQNGDLWQANIPQQYYNSKVVYYLTVADNIGNTMTIRDSVCINLRDLYKMDTVILGMETNADSYAPVSMSYNYSWSRQLYLYREICPDMYSEGTYITKIAWQSLTANAIYTNQTCYMRAIDDKEVVAGYLDPLLNGASQVWAGTLTILPGWVEITLDTSFYLPANKNLEIFWQNLSGFYTNSIHTWAHTQTQDNMTIFAQSNISFSSINSTGTKSYYRPNIKITKEDFFNPYTGNDLGLLSFLSPVSDLDNLCGSNYEPVRILLGNLGENDYDFSVDTILIQFEITDPQQTKYTGYIPIHTGKLVSRKAESIELMAALPVMYAGKYELKAWLESPIDTKPYDDTLVYVYTAGSIELPVDENFSGNFPPQFISQAINTAAQWTIVSQGSGKDIAVRPAQGSGMLAFTGNMGAITHLSTRQLGLTGTILPMLEFWYFHDTVPSNDYMDVRISTDGGASYTLLLSLLKQGATYGWKYYKADLTPYTNGQCVRLLFEAMRMSPGSGSQYIDRIVISSQPDLAISKVELPLQFACDLSAAELQIELSTLTSQTIDLSQFSTSLAVEIPGYQTLSPIPLQKRMDGNSSDTISISVPGLPSGQYTVKTYLTSPVDNQPGNDTAYYIVDIQPSLSVTVNPVTTANSRINIGSEVWQDVVIRNTGNTGISGIELVLRITGTNQYIIREPLPVNLSAGESYTHQFVNSYIVPADERYQVYLAAYMACDSAHVNAGNAIDEYVDMHNLSVVSIDNPPAGQPDTAGAAVNITVSIANTDDVNSFNNVSIFAAIETEEGQMQITRLGSIEEILPLDTLQFTFGESYTVPEDSVYRIRVYLTRVDNYPEDDTTETIRRTISGDVSVKGIDGANIFTLGQNIPNPANNRTRIDYSIPETGDVIFHVHSVSGQLLYSKTIEAASGKQSLELNTSTFAAGIYFYSIEYKGQRLVKRMMISD